jgi:hypothetical protein
VEILVSSERVTVGGEPKVGVGDVDRNGMAGRRPSLAPLMTIYLDRKSEIPCSQRSWGCREDVRFFGRPPSRSHQRAVWRISALPPALGTHHS